MGGLPPYPRVTAPFGLFAVGVRGPFERFAFSFNEKSQVPLQGRTTPPIDLAEHC